MRSANGRSAPAEIGLLLYPGCQTATVHGMTDLLQTASGFSADRGGPALRVSHWSLNGSAPIARTYDSMPSAGDRLDVAMTPGRLSGPVTPDEAAPFARWLADRHAEGATLASSCAGAFLLAETGLLAGRAATTHWLFADAFRARFPDVKLDPDKIVIEDGDIITAGGLMAWTDLGLRIVDRTLGPTVLVETARFFLIDPAGREQRHYSSFSPRLTHGDAAILRVQQWLQAKEDATATVPEMAQRAALEERTFLRRFKAATGMKPTEYVRHLRVGRARELLQFTTRSVDQVAWAVGYRDATAFRRIFNRIVGLTPRDYRRRFGAGPSATAAAATA
ncbi:GlxA family transcriptional regulator [Marinivivus vitaminiproducens]|uniref:GlxA family transcriptional regulator n=1 Tax=Marinivivus vitaminiproducens TaxID=3035935 RepID=UPI00279AEB2F|nr:GlxA family transcriptional regulator [Geminicoccaceae bacterium SCSIO 64248]